MYQNNPPPKQKIPPGPGQNKLNFWSTLIWFLVLVVLFTWLWRQNEPTSGNLIQIDYSTFRQQVQAGNVARIVVEGEEIRGQLRQPADLVPAGQEEAVTGSDFLTYLPSFPDDTLMPLLEEYDVALQTEPESSFSILSLVLTFLPFLFFLAIGYFFYSRMRQQERLMYSMQSSHARRYDGEQEHTTFDDVAGLEGAKTELQEIVAYLTNPLQVRRLGGKVPKGVLLVGPPGTGKTLLARAVAGEAGVPFFSITGSDFMEVFVGVGASRVRSLFADARKSAPSIIFIDELDSIGRLRSVGLGGAHEERDQTLNQLLSELDGFEPSAHIIVLAATNRPDILDPALLRPGRFDRHVTISLPSLSAREKILAIHARNKPLADDVDLARLARGTPGFSGADLENVLNEAALLAARSNKWAIEWQDVEEARDKVMMGLVREGLAPTEEECRFIAYHEAGHAILAAVLPNADPTHKVTIVPRGMAMGATQQLPERERFIYTREFMMDQLTVMMGGRAAETIIFDTAASGAENDLKHATQLARQMVLDWGMSERLGHMALGDQPTNALLGPSLGRPREYSEATAREIDEEIKAILEEAYQQATTTLQRYHSQLDAVAGALLLREELTGEEVQELLKSQTAAPPTPAVDGRQPPRNGATAGTF